MVRRPEKRGEIVSNADAAAPGAPLIMIRRHVQRHATSLIASALALACGSAVAQNYPITPQQRNIAQQTAQAGVPIDLNHAAPRSTIPKNMSSGTGP